MDYPHLTKGKPKSQRVYGTYPRLHSCYVASWALNHEVWLLPVLWATLPSGGVGPQHFPTSQILVQAFGPRLPAISHV